jgi:hypothetical protein
MKSLGGGGTVGRIPTETDITHEECRRYALSLPITSLVAGIISMEELKAEVAIARNFKPMSDAGKEELLKKAAPVAGDGRHELFKSTQQYDGPHHREQHDFAV